MGEAENADSIHTDSVHIESPQYSPVKKKPLLERNEPVGDVTSSGISNCKSNTGCVSETVTSPKHTVALSKFHHRFQYIFYLFPSGNKINFI